MRRLAFLAAVLALAAPGLAAVGLATAAPAAASVSVPAPTCDSFSSEIDCYELSSPSGVSVTWYFHQSNYIPPNWTITGHSSVTQGCNPGWAYQVYYSYVSGGVTYISTNSDLVCVKGDP